MNRTLLLICGLLISWTVSAQKIENKSTPNTTRIEASISQNVQIKSLGSRDEIEIGNDFCKSKDLTNQYYDELGVREQVRAAYMSLAAQMEHMDVQKSGGTIPVIFHIVYNPSTPATNVAYSRILNLFNELVQDYNLQNTDRSRARTNHGFIPSNVGINFCLATKNPSGQALAEPGVVRVQTSQSWYNSDNNQEVNKMKSSATGGSQSWDRTKYLNVWICNITNGANYGTAGYAYMPSPSYLPQASIDGIVIDYNIGLNTAHVLSHEVGHYLGLDHTWGEGGCNPQDDDGFSDTPKTQGPSFDYVGSCSGNQTTCQGIQTQYENFMDYSNCTVMFTLQQSNYMNTILNGIRSSLLTSNGCDPIANSPIVNFNTNLAEPIVVTTGTTVNFRDLSTNTPTSWAWNFGGGATNSTLQNPSVTFNTAGTYNVTLNATNTNGTGTLTKNGYIKVVTPTTPSSCDTLRNYNTAANKYTIPYTGGYIGGTGRLDPTLVITQWAEPYSVSVPTTISSIRIAPSKVRSTTGGNVVFKVYANNSGKPGAVLAQQTVSMNSLTALQYNSINFTTPASVDGTFFVGYQMSAANFDTLVILANYNETGTPINKTMMYIAGGINDWEPVNEVFTNVHTQLIMDVLTSRGGSPSLVVSSSNLSVCSGGSVEFNGNASTNVNDFEYYLLGSTGNTPISSSRTAISNFTIANPGNYRVVAYGNGACGWDEEVFNITVSPKPTAVLNSRDAECNLNNGSITVSNFAAGNGSPYLVSKDGTNFSNGTITYNALTPGNYTITVKNDASACLSTYNATILNGDCLSISNTEENNVLVYPNPTNNIITIEAENAIVELLDLNGKQIQSISINVKGQLDLSGLSQGVYLLQIKGANANKTVRIEKM